MSLSIVLLRDINFGSSTLAYSLYGLALFTNDMRSDGKGKRDLGFLLIIISLFDLGSLGQKDLP
jgi:hypothetical protein